MLQSPRGQRRAIPPRATPRDDIGTYPDVEALSKGKQLTFLYRITVDASTPSAREIPAQLTSLLINYAGPPVSNGFRADTIT